MRLGNLIKEEYVIADLQATTKEAAISELLGLLKQDSSDINALKIRDLIFEREEIENTSYGHGFAFPHARTDEVDDLIIILGISKNGLKENTPDNVPLTVVVVLLTPSHISNLYLQTLSAFATFARNEANLGLLNSVDTAADIVDIIWKSAVRVEKELTVKDIMRRNIATVTPEDSLKHVANMMFKHRLSAMAVVDENYNLMGQISDKDLIQAALPDYKSLINNLNYDSEVEPFEELLKDEDKIKVSQLYKTDHELTTLDTRIVEVAALMIFKDFRRVFVVSDDGKLIGILLRKDIVNMIIRG
ncbi:MAG: PTS transporter subunit EIIA [candidate division Zixibacteria bacterium]|nr:PTS transporter subunit EIIA [candidate division Zixibacteria bacterium]